MTNSAAEHELGGNVCPEVGLWAVDLPGAPGDVESEQQRRKTIELPVS